MRSISAIIGSFLMMTILAAAATERPSSYETLLATVEQRLPRFAPSA